VLWMLPPMIYRTMNPGLHGLDTENAYLLVCRQVLPAGLMGLILTGMYFSTSASANTALNVVSAVFTNDIYKGVVNPGASDKKLMQVARLSSWMFGVGMIAIALIVPYIGGIVEFTLSVAALTGGPLLAPPIWALFSKRLTGKATLWITTVSLLTNLFFKLLFPLLTGIRLGRADEMLVGVGLPFLLLVLNEAYGWRKGLVSEEYVALRRLMKERKSAIAAMNGTATVGEAAAIEETEAIKRQNQFGLKVIAFSLAFIALLLYILSLFTTKGTGLVDAVATLILAIAVIPFIAARRNDPTKK
jgi:SSS family solute:Na+ symporter